jgi:hypothetical protein
MSVVAVSPPPFKNRRGWAIAFGIFEILIGCLVLLGIVLIAVASRLAPANASAPPMAARFLIGTAVFYGALACSFVAVGIGNVKLQRWARITMLAFSWVWLAMGVLSTAMFAAILPAMMSAARQNSAQAMPQNFEVIFRSVMFGVLGIFFIVTPLVFVLFYSGKNVKATYENAAGAAATSPRKPIAVLIATAWFTLGALGYLFIFAAPILPLYGVVLRGWQAILAACIFELVNLWLALNLYRQRQMAWKVALAFICLSWVSLPVTMARMGTGGMYRAMGYTEAQVTQMAPIMNYILGFSALVAAGFIIMLILTRKHYHDAPATSV